MAHELSYEFDKNWANGNRWVAIEGEDFPLGEADLFIIWLQEQANDLDLWAQTRVSRNRYSTELKIVFHFVEREDDLHP